MGQVIKKKSVGIDHVDGQFSKWIDHLIFGFKSG